MQSTLLSNLLAFMDAYRDVKRIEEQFKVRAIDEALRALKRDTEFPWAIKQSTLKVFDNVLAYPVATDHDELAYMDTEKGDSYSSRARFTYTSLKQFFEDNQSDRNQLAEIWDGGTKYLGVRYKRIENGSQLLSNAEVASNYTASGDADSVALDEVNFKEGSGSIKVVVTDNTGTATVKDTFTAFVDGNYKRKYHFKWVYLDAVPTSISLRLHVDDSNYIETTGITTQFSGQALKADSWNLIAHDLNNATETGTIATTSSWAYEEIDLVGAATGVYYLDSSYLRAWENFDYWYYSKNNVVSAGSSVADKPYFFTAAEAYDIGDALVGDSEWVGVILYEAMEYLLGDIDNVRLFSLIQRKKAEAWENFYSKYPNITPTITTKRYRFDNNPQTSSLRTFYDNN